MKPKNKLIFLFLFFALFLIGAFWVAKSILKVNRDVNEIDSETRTVVGGNRDEHDCIGSAGYTWCEPKQKCLREWEEPCENEEALNQLKNLERETQIDFSGIAVAEFIWKIKGEKVGKVQGVEEVEVSGKSFGTVRISDDQYRDIETFFKDSSFEIDVYNVAAGTIGSSTGYLKDTMVCVVEGGTSGYKEAVGQWVPSEPDKRR